MRSVIIILAMLFLFSTAYAQDSEDIRKLDPLLVADQLYYWENDAENIGIEIGGKFNSREKMAETFSLLQNVGTFRAREWVLADILISVDFNANGDVAGWQVSGPKPLLLSYLEKLKAAHKDESIFYSFSYSFINCKPSAYFEGESE